MTDRTCFTSLSISSLLESDLAVQRKAAHVLTYFHRMKVPEYKVCQQIMQQARLETHGKPGDFQKADRDFSTLIDQNLEKLYST